MKALIVCILAVHLLGQPRNGAPNNERNADNHAPDTITVINNQKTTADTDKIKAGVSRWYTSSEWWLVIIAGITAAFICWQARETARATRAMRDSLPHQERAAQAALQNASALVNAERAWIVPELNCLSNRHTDGRWYDRDGTAFTTEEVLRGTHMRYALKFTNMGRTPANITTFQISYTLLPEGVTDLPASAGGDLSERREFNQFIAGGDAAEVTEPIIDVETYTKGSWLPIRALEKTAVFHGWVRYRHMFSREEDQADFCYVYTVSLNRLSSVSRHTKYTQQGDKAN
jgi:hypothetical protein